MRFIHFSAVAFALLATAACSNRPDAASVEGRWVQPIPGMEQEEQGFVLEKGGAASSINMHTLLYEHWELAGERLILQGKSLGNGQTIAFSDTLLLKSVGADSLVLQKGQLLLRYRRDG